MVGLFWFGRFGLVELVFLGMDLWVLVGRFGFVDLVQHICIFYTCAYFAYLHNYKIAVCVFLTYASKFDTYPNQQGSYLSNFNKVVGQCSESVSC